LLHVTTQRKEIDNATYEANVQKGLKELRQLCEEDPEFKKAFLESIDPVIENLKILFERLFLKDL